MARLILSLDGQTLAEYNMTKERYTVGRLPDNDIRIDNAAVSGHHSLIINILNDSFLEDLNSTNGTYVNGKLIKKHALQHDDVITVGHHQLRYVDDQAEDARRTSSRRPWSSSRAGRWKNASRRPPGQRKLRQRSWREPRRGQAGDDDRKDVGREAAYRRPRKTSKTPAATPALAKLQVLSGHVCGPRARAHQGTHDARPPRHSSRRHHAPRGRLFHRPCRERRKGQLPARQRHEHRTAGAQLQDNDVIQLAGVKMGFFLN